MLLALAVIAGFASGMAVPFQKRDGSEKPSTGNAAVADLNAEFDAALDSLKDSAQSLTGLKVPFQKRLSADSGVSSLNAYFDAALDSLKVDAVQSLTGLKVPFQKRLSAGVSFLNGNFDAALDSKTNPLEPLEPLNRLADPFVPRDVLET